MYLSIVIYGDSLLSTLKDITQHNTTSLEFTEMKSNFKENHLLKYLNNIKFYVAFCCKIKAA